MTSVVQNLEWETENGKLSPKHHVASEQTAFEGGCAKSPVDRNHFRELAKARAEFSKVPGYWRMLQGIFCLAQRLS